MNKEISKWKLVKNFVNSHEIFTKKEMRDTLKLIKSSNYTESQYVNHMLNAGFVKRIGRGKYQRMIDIPISLSTTKIVQLSYMNRKEREKYILKLVRKQKIKNIIIYRV